MNNLTTTTPNAMIVAGQAANRAAAANVFADYLSRKASNTVKAQLSDLTTFSAFLSAAGLQVAPESLQAHPEAWEGISWGIVEAFVKWQLGDGYSVASVNRRLSTVKVYCGLAAKAGAISAQDLALIKTVSGYGSKEGKRINERREVTSKGHKKPRAVVITDEQAAALKNHPDTPQGRRDTLLMCLLLDHGLRAGEVAELTVNDFHLGLGELNFYRSKVDVRQTHRLTRDALEAVHLWLEVHPARTGLLLYGTRKSGELTHQGMTPTNISERVRSLGAAIGIDGLSAHDCRHYWATKWAPKVDLFRLQEAGGWASLNMPRHYVEKAQIANQGMA